VWNYVKRSTVEFHYISHEYFTFITLLHVGFYVEKKTLLPQQTLNYCLMSQIEQR
jgi:hypothetical protein